MIVCSLYTLQGFTTDKISLPMYVSDCWTVEVYDLKWMYDKISQRTHLKLTEKSEYSACILFQSCLFTKSV